MQTGKYANEMKLKGMGGTAFVNVVVKLTAVFMRRNKRGTMCVKERSGGRHGARQAA